MKILIIDDDLALIAALRRGLRSLYVVDAVAFGGDGLYYALNNSYDAIILDLGLPDLGGKEVCSILRAKEISAPILVLTGSVSIKEKVILLDVGADDYITKPFSLEELKARLRVLVRRQGHLHHTSALVVGSITLDSSTRKVKRGRKEIMLRRKEFDLLEYLMHNAGKVVTRAMILEHVWDMNEMIWTNAVDVHIKHLRDKVDRPFEHAMIKTVHGVGYQLLLREN